MAFLSCEHVPVLWRTPVKIVCDNLKTGVTLHPKRGEIISFSGAGFSGSFASFSGAVFSGSFAAFSCSFTVFSGAAASGAFCSFPGAGEPPAPGCAGSLPGPSAPVRFFDFSSAIRNTSFLVFWHEKRA